MTDDNDRRLRLLYVRLSALLDQVRETRPEGADKPGHPGSGLGPLVMGYLKLVEHVREVTKGNKLIEDALSDLPSVPGVGPHLAAHHHVTAKQAMIFGIGLMLQVLAPEVVTSTGTPPNVSVEREGLFVAGQQFDALLAATRILSTAQSSIVLVDGYIRSKVLELMKTKPENATVAILTKAAKLPADIKPLAIAFNQQYGQKAPMSIRTSDAFHDRFLIIDDSHFYHFGSSLKDLGTRGFMFSLIEEPTIVGMLRRNVADEWSKGAVVV